MATQEKKDVDKLATATEIVRKNMYWAAGVGVVPVPVVDFVGVTGVQVKMLAELCTLYEVEFRKNLGKNLIGSLVGSAVPLGLSMPVASLLKALPLVGSTLGAVSMPVLAGASTYAVGKVFVQHFECGGTLLTFDPEKVREYFAEQLKDGKKLATQKD
jgi:uncharacterized protein (DUF697 family)